MICEAGVARLLELRDRLEQRLGVRHPHVGEERARRRLLDDLAGVHHGDLVGAAGDDAEVVGDEDHRHVRARAAAAASRLRIWACTVTSRAVVGSSAKSSFGPQASAMAIVTRWRMPPDSSCGYCVEAAFGFGDADRLQQLRAPCSSASSLRHVEVVAQRLGDLAADLHHRVERRHRVLEHHRHLGAPERRAARRLESAGELACRRSRTLPVAVDVAAGEQAHDRAGQHRLARAGLADDAERLAAVEAKVTPSTAFTRPLAVLNARVEVGDLEQARRRAVRDRAIDLLAPSEHQLSAVDAAAD